VLVVVVQLVAGSRVAIVGGSIAGLSVAAALARDGYRPEVFERAPRTRASAGAGLSIDRRRLAAVAGGSIAGALAGLRLRERIVDTPWGARSEPADVEVSSWHLLREALARAAPQIVEERAVTAYEAGRLCFEDGSFEAGFALVVFADGGDSLGRRVVGAESAPVYAGYVLVRAFLAEGHLPAPLRAHFCARPALHLVVRSGGHFVGYVVPGERGETTPGARRLNFGLYLPRTEAPARTPDRAEAERLAKILARWPGPVKEVVERALAAGAVTLHAVREVVSTPLVAANVCLVGDAAHLASPITGSGARMAMDDAIALAEALREERGALEPALARYAAIRVPVADAVVRSAAGFGAQLVASG